jgi:hypothetical protein
MAAYLAGVQERLRRSDLERAAAQARAAEERRRRRAQLAAVTAAVLLVAGGAGWRLWAQQQRQQADSAVAGSMKDAKGLRDEARQANTLAELKKFDDGLTAAEKATDLALTAGPPPNCDGRRPT